jgi:uncharacterized protein YjeT (DUF2065 family)
MYPPLHVAFVSLHSLNATSIFLIVVDVVIVFILKCFKKIVLLLVLEGLLYVLPFVLDIHTTNPIDKLDIFVIVPLVFVPNFEYYYYYFS